MLFSFVMCLFVEATGMFSYQTAGVGAAIGGSFPSFWAMVPGLRLEDGLLRKLPSGCFEDISDPAYLGGVILCGF